MKLTPLDIHHKEFGHALRGYNEVEVDTFLDQVADELERLFKENIDLSERIEGLEEKVRSYQDMERTLHNTLMNAQKSADELVHKAQREAEVVLKDAEVKAKEVIHVALTNKQKATSDLGRIKQAEDEFRSKFKALLEGHLGALGEVSLPEDVSLMMGQAGEEIVVEAEVFDKVPTFEPAQPIESPGAVSEWIEENAEPEPEPEAVAEEAGSEAELATEVPEAEPERPAVVASLHLGDLGTPDIEPDSTVEFDVAEFGFGERDDEVDIEEID
ncbi:MAG: DivIVA domain-containing protein [Coriobacteriia bacterium]|nr:DivIVA domain-containing protein [Coriobacteriia bacterium]